MKAKPTLALIAGFLMAACGGTEEAARQEQSLSATVDLTAASRPWPRALEPNTSLNWRPNRRRPETIDVRYLSTGVEVAGLYVMTVRDYGSVCDGQPLPAPIQPVYFALVYVRDIGPMEVGVESDFGLSFHLFRPGQQGLIDYRGPAVWRIEESEQGFAIRVSGQFSLDHVDWRLELRPPEMPDETCPRLLKITGHTLIPNWLKEIGKSMPGKH